ncbi:MAG: radical SAM family heme chaperone HemW [Desulfuromonadales bacterium]|nr:radical SAM family heme chaperone HemW [Desulfuromonadales bacterium]
MAGLYLHIPFCRQKCPYCDFYSREVCAATISDYPSYLERHLTWAAEHREIQPIDTIYFGGGTPSLLEPTAIARILQTVDQTFDLSINAEITLEANPGTVSLNSLNGYRNAGVNRLSLGLQTCSNDQLTLLGRLHNRQGGIDACNWAREAGFDNLSLDLMFALPDQTLRDLEDDLCRYLELAPEHLSCYGLTAEPETPFQQRVASGELALPDGEFYADAFMLIHEQLATAGYEHYEIANYARDGYTCRHNLGYWQRRPYLGIGAGAHSFFDSQWGSRWEVPADLSAYRQALLDGQEPMKCLETFDRQSALSETIYLGLRTRHGIADTELLQHFGCTLQDAFPEAVAASAQWLVNDDGRWSLTPSGWLLFNRLILPFL